MLHHSQEIIRFCLIAYPCFFAVMAGLDLMLRIANAFTASTSPQIQTEKAIEDDALPALEPIVRTSDETQTQQAIELEPVSELEPASQTEPQQPATETPLSQLKRYKLHGHDVVPVNQLSIPLPATIKRYKLRGMAVVRISDIA